MNGLTREFAIGCLTIYFRIIYVMLCSLELVVILRPDITHLTLVLSLKILSICVGSWNFRASLRDYDFYYFEVITMTKTRHHMSWLPADGS